jgi:hypothetical protein
MRLSLKTPGIQTRFPPVLNEDKKNPVAHKLDMVDLND